MIKSFLKTIGILLILAIVGLTAGCGGGSSASTSTSTSTSTDSVSGIPSAASVSAVSAN